MATNLLSDELKSDMTYLIPPITKEQIVKEVNALIYHFKSFGVCYESDINYPFGNNYLESVTAHTIIKENFGTEAASYIEKLKYLYIPLELNDIIIQLNLIVDILKSGIIISSYYFENLKNDIYKNSPNIKNRNGFATLNYNNDLNVRISNLSKLNFPVTYINIINLINSIIELFKKDARIVDANDLKLLIVALKREDSEVYTNELKDYGDSLIKDVDFIYDYKKANTTTEEFQSNLNLNLATIFVKNAEILEEKRIDYGNSFSKYFEFLDFGNSTYVSENYATYVAKLYETDKSEIPFDIIGFNSDGEGIPKTEYDKLTKINLLRNSKSDYYYNIVHNKNLIFYKNFNN